MKARGTSPAEVAVAGAVPAILRGDPMNAQTKTEATQQARSVETAKKSGGVRVRSGVKAGPGGFGNGGLLLNHNATKGVRVRSGVKAGGWNLNHNATKGVRVRSGVKAGPGGFGGSGVLLNHNQAKGVRVRSGLKAGDFKLNHNHSFARA